MIRALGKRIYYALPGKQYLFRIVRSVYDPPRRLAAYLKFEGVFTLDLPGGARMKLFNDNSTIPTMLFWKGLKGHEPCSVDVWCKLSRNASTVVDLGANFGLFGLLAKGIRPDGTVLLMEPLARNVARIQHNFMINGWQAITVTKAVGDREGSITFYDMDTLDNTIGSIDEAFVRKHQHHTNIIPIDVPMTRLDTVVAEQNLTRVDLMKIDVEGAEVRTLNGALNTITNHRPNILLEVTDAASAELVNAYLAALPFRYTIYELDDAQGPVMRASVAKSNSRNYLLTMDTDLLRSLASAS